MKDMGGFVVELTNNSVCLSPTHPSNISHGYVRGTEQKQTEQVTTRIELYRLVDYRLLG